MSCPNRDFLEITVHTARCGDCNARNTSLLKRCPRCGHQQCVPCNEIRNGAHGMHLMNRSSLPAVQSGQTSPSMERDPSSVGYRSGPGNGEGSSRQPSKRSSRKRDASREEPAQVPKRKKLAKSSMRGDAERLSANNAGRRRPGTSDAPISIRSSSPSPGLFVSAPARSATHARPEAVRWSPRSDDHQRSQYRPLSPSLPTPSPASPQSPNVTMAPRRQDLPVFGRFFEADSSIFDDVAHQGGRELLASQTGLVNGDTVVPSIEIYEDSPALDATSSNTALAEDQEATQRRHRDHSASTIVDEYTPTAPIHYRADSTPEPIPLASLPSHAGPLPLQELPVERREPPPSNGQLRHRRNPFDFPDPPQQQHRNDERRSSPGNEENEDPAQILNRLPLSSSSTQRASPASRQSPTRYVVARPWPSTAPQQSTRTQVQITRRIASSDTEEELAERRPRRARFNRVVLDDEEDEEEGNPAESQFQPGPNLRLRGDAVIEQPAHHAVVTRTPEQLSTTHRSTPLFSAAQLRPRERSPSAYNHRATRSGRFAPRQPDNIPALPTATMSTQRPVNSEPALATRTRARPGTYEALEEELDKIPFDEAHYRQPRPPLPPFVGLDKLKPASRASVVAYREDYERGRQQEIADFDTWKFEEHRKLEEKRLAESRRRRRAAERSYTGPAHPPEGSRSARVHPAGRSTAALAESGMIVSKEGIVYSAVRDLPPPKRNPRADADPRTQTKKMMQHLPGEDWDWESYGKLHGALHMDDQLPPAQRKLSREEREKAEQVLLEFIPDTLPLKPVEKEADKE
ncbi:uncharacterized protein J3D65DRAFT_659825 [Phyllosticta citribraziliensis]|uniref:Uncharacterized protein n=1 Tax=Phyllosticta citribraziliensis TaxID=989973 RepID=A0ABR1LIH0_9PEZI